MSKVKCAGCKQRIPREDAIHIGIQSFCSIEHIRLAHPKKKAKKKYPMPDGLRGQVLAADGYCCARCGAKQDLHVHHIVYLSEGGKHERSNLITLCRDHHNMGNDSVHNDKKTWQPFLLNLVRKRDRMNSNE